ncbi:Thiol-specific monooxygenase [Mycena venus]|uniref:Thiol-specific monooxygenase n=1 Tax=Mycena venus TaxID=2733690 RepID=A0A8H6XH95_9AGAR|nr:Thiol-specific monooxygenase [Mycena venus]
MTAVLSPKPRRVLIVGGGPCGLVSLRNLVERGQFEEVVLAERRNDIGGVWYLEDLPKPGTPRTTPFWPSPAYPALVGNVLAEYLSFSHHPFPEPESKIHPYPSLADTYAYLRRFAAPFLASGQIRLATEVVWIDELPESRSWSVTTRDWRVGKGGEVHVETWDAVVVATSWYDFPSWPESTPGLAEARAAGLATHAQTWHGPVGYEGKRVVVVGNANSSNDITAQLKVVAQTPIFRSIRRQGLRRFAFLPDPRVIDVPPITRYIVKSSGKLDLEFLDGLTLTDIDAVVLGTGYSAASAPFVRVLQPPLLSLDVPQPQTLTALTSATTFPPRIPSLYNHILYAPNPTLAFIGAVMSYTPFTLADVASTWLALFFAGRLTIPSSLPARLEGERARLEKIRRVRDAGAKQEGRELSSLVAYHILGPDEQGYAQGLKNAIAALEPEWARVLPEWSDQDWKKREAMYERKWASLMAEQEAEKKLVNLASGGDGSKL